jgi:putative ABC transport system permease protein
MKILDTLSLSTRMFKTRKMRTFLTILGVGVGIGTVLFLVSLGYGLQRVISNKIGSSDALLSLDVSPGSSAIVLDDEGVKKMAQIKNVVEVSPMVNYSAQVSYGKLTGDGLVYATKQSFFRLSGIVPDKGTVFSGDDVYETVISSAAAKLFNIDIDQAVGQEINLFIFKPKSNQLSTIEESKDVGNNQKYKIVGVINDDATSYAFVPLDTTKFMGGVNYSQLKLKVADKQYLDEIRTDVINQGFLVSSLSDTLDQADKIFRIIQIVLAMFGLVALIVSAIGMFNTMTIALLERITEIGIMRSIGASSSDVMFLFMIESLLMGFLGGVGGVAIGYAAGEATNLGLNLLAKNFGGQVLNIFYRPMWFVALIIGFSSFIGFLTGVFPAMKASRLNPLDALRYK